MAGDDDDDDKKPFDPFELAAAILLGLAALGTAWCGYQAGLWGGKSVEAYGEAATIATKASAQYNRGVTFMNRDMALDLEIKKAISEATSMAEEFQEEGTELGPRDAIQQDLLFEVSEYLIRDKLSDQAYKALGFPVELRASKEELPDEQSEKMLVAALESELDDKYRDAMVAEGNKTFAEADKKFDEGRVANNEGDKFELGTVLFTVALFLGGLGLVFKTNVRWGFYVCGMVIFVVATVYMVRLPMAG